MAKRKVLDNENCSPNNQSIKRDSKQRQSKLHAIAVVCNETVIPTRYPKRIRNINIYDSASTDKTSTSASSESQINDLNNSLQIGNREVYVQLDDIALNTHIYEKDYSQYGNLEVYVKLEDIAQNNNYLEINKKLKIELVPIIKTEIPDSVKSVDRKEMSTKRVAVKKEETLDVKEKKEENEAIGGSKTKSDYPLIPVDKECSTLANQVHIFCEDDAVYGVMLNQTNLQYNNNKFYLIQLLKHNQKPDYYVWMRWARVGKIGQTKLVSFGGDLESAKDCFTQKFFDKTRNYWEDRASFTKVHRKYDLVYIDYSQKPVRNQDEHQEPQKVILPVIESKLDEKIQDLIRIFFDIQEMNSTVSEMRYDVNKMPLGRLSEVQIRAGYIALRQIEGLINEGYDGRKKLIQACNDYYTRVPHDFGMHVPPVICSIQEIKRELELLETLSDIKVALSLLHKVGASDIHALDRNYHNLKCDINPITPSDPVYQLLKTYLESTHGATHSSYNLELIDMFSVRKDQEWSNYDDCGNRMLLWHGSRTTNYAGILSQGLRITPKEAPLTGHMFGKGVYFTDTSSKSANYVYPSRSKNEGFLLLCEVALGTSNELVRTDEKAHRLPPGCHSVKGLGIMSPDRRTWTTMDDGVVVPLGVLVDTGLAQKHKGYVLNYNEYIVYRTSQIKMRYLLRVRFNYK